MVETSGYGRGTAEIIETRRDELAISVELSQTEIENSPVFAAARLDSGQDTEASGSSGKRKGKKN